MAVLVLLPAAAGARIIAPDFGTGIGRLQLRLIRNPQCLVEAGMLVLYVLHVGVRRCFLNILW